METRFERYIYWPVAVLALSAIIVVFAQSFAWAQGGGALIAERLADMSTARREMLGLGIIALTLISALLMLWRLPMNREVGYAGLWGSPSAGEWTQPRAPYTPSAQGPPLGGAVGGDSPALTPSRASLDQGYASGGQGPLTGAQRVGLLVRARTLRTAPRGAGGLRLRHRAGQSQRAPSSRALRVDQAPRGERTLLLLSRAPRAALRDRRRQRPRTPKRVASAGQPAERPVGHRAQLRAGQPSVGRRQ